MYTLLNNRSIYRIAGEDRVKFLQGLLSNDITKINNNNPIYACMLTAQGKYFADFFLICKEEEILFDIPSLRQNEILKKLNMYKLRSAVTISKCLDYQPIAILEEKIIDNLNKSVIFKDPRSDELGMRGFIHNEDIASLLHAFVEDKKAYDKLRIDNFIPEGDKDLIPEKSFLAEYGLDSLNAIDYNKGCYVGQELVARTHYLGQVRKQIVKAKAKNNLPALGTEIYAGEQKLGIVCSSVDNKGLALIRTEDVMELSPETKIIAGDLEIELIFKEKIND